MLNYTKTRPHHTSLAHYLTSIRVCSEVDFIVFFAHICPLPLAEGRKPPVWCHVTSSSRDTPTSLLSLPAHLRAAENPPQVSSVSADTPCTPSHPHILTPSHICAIIHMQGVLCPSLPSHLPLLLPRRWLQEARRA